MWSQVLVLLSDTGQHGQTLLSVPKHSQTQPRRLQDGHQAPKRPPRPPKDPQEDPKSTPKVIQKLSSGPSKTIEKHNILKDFSKIQPLLFVFFSMLIKSELQTAFRSAQKRPRTPQDAQPPPTWSQHGANMGSKRGAKIGPRALEIWSRGDLRPKSLSDLSMDPKWTPKWTPDGPKCTQNIPRMDSNSTPKSTSDGPFIDSQIDFRWTIHRLPNQLQKHSRIRSQIEVFTS